MTPEAPQKLHRPFSPDLDAILGVPAHVLDHGFVRVIDYMGDDAAVVQAARVSYGKGTKAVSDDRGLIRYLMRHEHTTPFEMAEIKLHLKMPIFVARQWIRHRTASINEYSARYSVLGREFYVPEGHDLAPQSGTNRQGREGSYEPHDALVLRQLIEFVSDASFDTYERMIDDKEGGMALSRELGRIVLPLGTYTEFYWKVDLHNLLRFLRLRTDPHAQKEIRVYAQIIEQAVKVWCPYTYDAWLSYQKNAVTLSAEMLKVVRALVNMPAGLDRQSVVAAAESAMSQRERLELAEILMGE